jgi:hypothetical protein
MDIPIEIKTSKTEPLEKTFAFGLTQSDHKKLTHIAKQKRARKTEIDIHKTLRAVAKEIIRKYEQETGYLPQEYKKDA